MLPHDRIDCHSICALVMKVFLNLLHSVMILKMDVSLLPNNFDTCGQGAILSGDPLVNEYHLALKIYWH